jgi:hypothetical protein
MEFRLLHTDQLEHKCILPFKIFNHLLSNNSFSAKGFCCLIEAIDTDDDISTVLGVEKFGEKCDDELIVPKTYLPDTSFVKLTLLTEPIFADKMILQSITNSLETEEDIEGLLVDYIQYYVPVINVGTILTIFSHQLKVVSLWKDDIEVKYTSTLNHDLSVDFLPSLETLARELQEKESRELQEKESRELQEKESRELQEKEGHVVGMTTATIARTREERLKAMEKRFG